MADTSTKSTTELIRQGLDDILRLLHKELELLKHGLIEALTDRLKAAGLILGAGLLFLPGLTFLFVALALWLPWSAAVGFAVVGMVMFIVAAVVIVWAVRLFKRGGKDSNEALDRVKEDARWARERVTR